MMAVFENDRNELCVVYSTGREGLKAISRSYCGEAHNAAEGVTQVPDALLTGLVVLDEKGKPVKMCPRCKERIPR